jgi:hypothetical protein
VRCITRGGIVDRDEDTLNLLAVATSNSSGDCAAAGAPMHASATMRNNLERLMVIVGR